MKRHELYKDMQHSTGIEDFEKMTGYSHVEIKKVYEDFHDCTENMPMNKMLLALITFIKSIMVQLNDLESGIEKRRDWSRMLMINLSEFNKELDERSKNSYKE